LQGPRMRGGSRPSVAEIVLILSDDAGMLCGTGQALGRRAPSTAESAPRWRISRRGASSASKRERLVRVRWRCHRSSFRRVRARPRERSARPRQGRFAINQRRGRGACQGAWRGTEWPEFAIDAATCAPLCGTRLSLYGQTRALCQTFGKVASAPYGRIDTSRPTSDPSGARQRNSRTSSGT